MNGIPDANDVANSSADSHRGSSGWQPIETAREWDRVIVAGWQPRSGNVAGYWWYHDDTIVDGKPCEHPNATLWHSFPEVPPPPLAALSKATGGAG